MAKSLNPGCPDILGILPGGKLLAIEVKRKGGRLSCNQEIWLERAKALGAVAFVAYSLDDVISKLDSFFADTKATPATVYPSLAKTS